MNFIVMIFPDGIVHKLSQDDPLYSQVMSELKPSAPTFKPYSDDGDLGLFYDVVGSEGSVRFKVVSTTTTTTTTNG